MPSWIRIRIPNPGSGSTDLLESGSATLLVSRSRNDGTVPVRYRIAWNETDLCCPVQRRSTGATTEWTARRIPCTEQMFPPHSQILTARSVHLFISRFVCYDRVDSSEDPVYGADVSATLTDPDCEVSSGVFRIRIRINLSCWIQIRIHV